MFRDSAKRWVSETYAHDKDAEAQWSEMAELGWLMIAIPEDVGGLGGTPYDVAMIAEALGHGLVRLPFVDVSVTAAQALLPIAPDCVEAIIGGEARPILAHNEPAARGDLGWVETTATQDGETWRLTGRKTGLVGAPFASSFLASAKSESGEISLFEIAKADAPLVEFTTIDDRPAGELRLDNTTAKLLSSDASAAIEAALDYSMVLESAEAVGTMQAAFDATKEYLLTRKQYGQLIGDFQALRHRFADMFIELEQARSMVRRGLDALTSEDERMRAKMAAATRARTAQAAYFVGAQSIQLHGGIGVTEEYPVGHYFKRLTAFCLRHGTAEAQVERFAELTHT